MTIQPGANVYTQGFGSRPENVEVPHIDTRAPSTTDVNYPIGKRWINTAAGTDYSLDQLVSSNGSITANWSQSGSETGALNTLSVGATTVTPTAGNIVIAGTASQITATGSNSPGTVTLSLPAAITTPGSLTTTTTLTATAGAITATNGNLVLGTAGNKLSIATGANASIGTSAAMTAGTITISTTAVTASSKIFLTANTPGGTQGVLSAPTASITAGTSFVINSSNALDTSTVNWWIVN